MYKSWKFHGKISLLSDFSYAKDFAKTLRVRDSVFSVDVEIRKDESGTEEIIYSTDGKPAVVLWCEGKDFAEYNIKDNLVTFRPAEEVALYGGAGFIVPNKTFRFSGNKIYDPQLMTGDPCKAGTDPCVNVILTMHFHGAIQVGQYLTAENRILSTVGGKKVAEWRISGGEVPSQINYKETAAVSGEITANAEYQLASVQQVNEKLETRALISKNAMMHLQKGRVIYGGSYDSKLTDIRRSYDHQDELWKTRLNQTQPTSGSSWKMGAAFLGTGVLLILLAMYVAKRKRTG
jgi:hypothetical protein